MVEGCARRSLPVRVAASVAGAVLGTVALPLAVPLPELGLPLLAVALRLLGLQFEWAHRLNVTVDAKIRELRRSVARYLRRPKDAARDEGIRRLAARYLRQAWRNRTVVTIAGVVLGLLVLNLVVNLIL